MKSIIVERIAEVLRHYRISETAFSKNVDLSQTAINKQLKGTSALSAVVVEAVATQFPTISMEWLIRGKGTMFASDTPSTTITNVSDSPIAINGSNITNPPSDSDALASAMQLIHSQYDFIHQQSLLIAQLKGQLK